MLNKLFSRIGKSISPTGGGVISAIFSRGIAPSFPPYGELLSTQQGVEYPISAGGGGVNYSGVNYPNQTADVDTIADGVGGTFQNWYNAVFKSNSQFTTYSENSPDIIVNGVNYGYGCSSSGDVYHNGSGGYDVYNQAGGCISNGTYIANYSGTYTIYVNGTNYTSGTYSNSIYHDGSGSYYESGTSDYTFYGIEFTSVGPIDITFDFNGTSYIGGTYVTRYYHDGSGSYYTENTNFSYTEAGIYISAGNVPTYVTIDTLQYQNGTQEAVTTHNGSGSYQTNYPYPSYYSNGIFIVSIPYPIELYIYELNQNASYGSGAYLYYNDGFGSYYSSNEFSYVNYGHLLGNKIETINLNAYEYPTGRQFEYRYSFGGSYYTDTIGSYYSYGTYITSFDSYDYYWDGYGYYYSYYNGN